MKIVGFKLLVIALVSLAFFSCGQKKSDNPNHIKVGVQSGPEYTVAMEAKRVALEKYGLEVELVEFNDYVTPNVALSQGDIDVNAFQHKQFLEEQNKQRGFKLVVVGNTFIYPIAAYSNKIKSMDELQDGSMVVVPNDLTNGGRALLLMAEKGLIKLKDNVGYTPSLADITENPKNLNISELEAPQLPRILDDNKVVMAIINNTYASQIGLYPEKGLFSEGADSPYVNVIAAREDNQNDEKVKNFVKAYQTEEVERVAKKEFNNSAVKGW